MKKLYKRVLAAVLCLALVAVIVPATAFALEKLPDRFASGKLDLKLCEPYFGDLRELLPEISIGEYIDQKKIDINSPDEEQAGMYFTVYLSDNTCEAVTDAIAALYGNPLVEYARPFNCYTDGRITIHFYEAYEGDVAALFPDIAIERIVESTEASRRGFAEQGKELSDRIKARMNKEFRIWLVDKSADAVLDAVEKMANYGYEMIESITPHQFTIIPGEYCIAEVVYPADPIEPEYEITVGDALKALRVAAGLEEATAELVAAYDKDGDGEITVYDALAVLRIAAGLA